MNPENSSLERQKSRQTTKRTLLHMITSARFFIALLAVAMTAWGNDFSFFTTMQAGLPGSPGWELGAGNTSATTQSNVNFEYNTAGGSTSWRSGDGIQNFKIGYDQGTGTGYVTVFNSDNVGITASYANPGSPLNANAVWSLPAANFFASANSIFVPATVNVENLTFSSGVQVLSGALPNSIGAAFPGSGPAVTNTAPSPIIFSAANSGGSWAISGTIRMNGIFAVNGLAAGNALQVGFGVNGTDVPEASSFLLLSVGFAALASVRHFRRA